MFAIPSALFAHFLPPVQTCNQIEELLKTSQEYQLFRLRVWAYLQHTRAKYTQG